MLVSLLRACHHHARHSHAESKHRHACLPVAGAFLRMHQHQQQQQHHHYQQRHQSADDRAALEEAEHPSIHHHRISHDHAKQGNRHASMHMQRLETDCVHGEAARLTTCCGCTLCAPGVARTTQAFPL